MSAKSWLRVPLSTHHETAFVFHASIQECCTPLQVDTFSTFHLSRNLFKRFKCQGVHPHDAKSWDDETLESLQELAKNQECVAIGECGLDFNRNFSEPSVQLEVFEKQVSPCIDQIINMDNETTLPFLQIQLACQVHKPLFLHERDAHTEMVGLLNKYKDRLPNCVIHCFTGSKEQALTYLNMGCYIGLTGCSNEQYLSKRQTTASYPHGKTFFEIK